MDDELKKYAEQEWVRIQALDDKAKLAEAASAWKSLTKISQLAVSNQGIYRREYPKEEEKALLDALDKEVELLRPEARRACIRLEIAWLNQMPTQTNDFPLPPPPPPVEWPERRYYKDYI